MCLRPLSAETMPSTEVSLLPSEMSGGGGGCSPRCPRASGQAWKAVSVLSRCILSGLTAPCSVTGTQQVCAECMFKQMKERMPRTQRSPVSCPTTVRLSRCLASRACGCATHRRSFLTVLQQSLSDQVASGQPSP